MGDNRLRPPAGLSKLGPATEGVVKWLHGSIRRDKAKAHPYDTANSNGNRAESKSRFNSCRLRFESEYLIGMALEGVLQGVKLVSAPSKFAVRRRV